MCFRGFSIAAGPNAAREEGSAISTKVVSGVLLATLVSVAVLLVAPGSATAPTAVAASYPPYPSRLIVKSELRYKADLMQRGLSSSPQLIFFGGSRSQRFDPAFARKRTGLRSANLAHSNARPEAAWAYVNWIYKRWPNAKLRWVWGVQPTMIRDRDMDPALLQDRRFYRCFPADLLAAQRRLLPGSVSAMPRFYGFQRNRYSDLGLLKWNVYDARRAAGYTLDRSLDAYIAKMLRPSHQEPRQQTGRARDYFEKTIKLLNEHGTTPVLVLMPTHPRVLRVIKEHGLGGSREALRDYLLSLAEDTENYDVQVLDFTRIQSFNGESRWFYDGVHITRLNANRVITAIRYKARDCLK